LIDMDVVRELNKNDLGKLSLALGGRKRGQGFAEALAAGPEPL
jgi:hypothetical protein